MAGLYAAELCYLETSVPVGSVACVVLMFSERNEFSLTFYD